MIVTFPHMGQAWVPLKSLFERNGIQVIVPPRGSRRTMSLGSKYSPEWMCLPFKINLGNIVEALEQGADTVLHVSGPGLCRLGNYSDELMEILHAEGYEFEMRTFDWQDNAIKSLLTFAKDMLGKDSWLETVGEIKFSFEQIFLMDSLEQRVQYLRPRVEDGRALEAIWRTAGERVCAAWTPDALAAVKKSLFEELNSLPVNPDVDPLKVTVLGEFFMCMDPFTNMDLELELGKRGVEVYRGSWLSGWAKIWLFLEAVGLGHGREMKKAASPYLSRDISGDAQQSIGETVLHAQEGFDGIVHLLPFTCMPEIIAQSMLPKVSRDHDIPVLSVILDEQMAKAGFVTRIEAFVDLMERRRRAERRARPDVAV